MKVGIIWILVLANLEKLKLWLIKALQAELQFENNPLAVLTRGFPCRQEMWSFRTRLRILIVFIERMVCSEKEDITEVSNSASGTRLTILITRCIPHHDTSASLEIWLCQRWQCERYIHNNKNFNMFVWIRSEVRSDKKETVTVKSLFWLRENLMTSLCLLKFLHLVIFLNCYMNLINKMTPI